MILAAALVLAAGAAAAPCMVIKDTPETVRAATLPRAQAMPGVYACRFVEAGSEIAARVELKADGTFAAEISDFEREGEAGRPDQRLISGRWVLRRDELSLIDLSVEPKLVTTSATVDPKVVFSLTIRTPAGKAVPDLGATMEGSSAFLALGGEPFVVPLSEGPFRGVIRIVREGDASGGFLGEVEIAPGRPNRFVLIYHDDRPEPRNLALTVTGTRNDVLVMPVGLGALLLRRDAR